MTALNGETLASAAPDTELPTYDRTAVRPGIVHFGVGSFHRAHQAVYLDTLLQTDTNASEYGIIGVNLMPGDRPIVDILRAQDCLYTLLVRSPDGTTRARVIGSIIDHLYAPDDPERLFQTLADPSVRIVTLTITEGGYFYSPGNDSIDFNAPELLHDIANPRHPQTAFGYILEGLRRRRVCNTPPFTVMSCDNVHANGDIARRVITTLADQIDQGFGAYVRRHVAFPNSMVDRITPRTTPQDIILAETLTGLADAWPVSTEPFTQWVIEDTFTLGRPALETVGAQLVADVRPYELMKMRLLNAGHQAIAYWGRLLGYEYGHEACADPAIRRLLLHFQLHEAARTLQPMTGTDYASYSLNVVERFSNPQIRDAMARLTFQSSTGLSTYVLPVIRDLLGAGRDATVAITIVACWARFLEGASDNGKPYDIVDARLPDLHARASRHDHDLEAVVRDNPSFVGLYDRTDFMRPYVTSLAAVRRDGVRGTLDEMVKSLPDVDRVC